MRLFRKGAERKSESGIRRRSISNLQADVIRYYGWDRETVNSDFYASKTVHMLTTIGYMEYDENCILTLTEKGGRLMQGIDLPKAATF